MTNDQPAAGDAHPPTPPKFPKGVIVSETEQRVSRLQKTWPPSAEDNANNNYSNFLVRWWHARFGCPDEHLSKEKSYWRCARCGLLWQSKPVILRDKPRRPIRDDEW